MKGTMYWSILKVLLNFNGISFTHKTVISNLCTSLFLSFALVVMLLLYFEWDCRIYFGVCWRCGWITPLYRSSTSTNNALVNNLPIVFNIYASMTSNFVELIVNIDRRETMKSHSSARDHHHHRSCSIRIFTF